VPAYAPAPTGTQCANSQKNGEAGEVINDLINYFLITDYLSLILLEAFTNQKLQSRQEAAVVPQRIVAVCHDSRRTDV